MRKVILQLAISLDGFIEGPNGEIDWCLTDQDYGMKEFLNQIDSLFMGRKTYELTLRMGGSGIKNVSEYVFSNSLKKVEGKAILLKGDIKTKVEKIKNQPGKNIWLFGGAEITNSLLNLDLIDEIHLAAHPILLGGGKKLFVNIDKIINLSLISSKTYSSGLVSLQYATIR